MSSEREVLLLTVDETFFIEEFLHSDPAGLRVLSLVGSEVQLCAELVSAEKRFPNASFVLSVRSDGSRAVYGDPSGSVALCRWSRDPSRWGRDESLPYFGEEG